LGALINSSSNCYTVDGVNDSEEFDITLAAMRAVGMGNSQIQMILSLVASVMHLGNVDFRSQQVGDTEGSVIFNKEPLNKFCQLTKLNPDILEHVLTFRELQTMAAGGKIETYEVTKMCLPLRLLLYIGPAKSCSSKRSKGRYLQIFVRKIVQFNCFSDQCCS
jgi:myosin heavy subunit